jgi:hypothetical protein
MPGLAAGLHCGARLSPRKGGASIVPEGAMKLLAR